VWLVRRLLLVLTLLPASLSAQQAPWTLHAVEHARSDDLPALRLLRSADLGARLEMSWLFHVARRGDRVVLIDVGTDVFGRDPRRRQAWRVSSHRPVTDALAALDLRPADVTDVVLTHHHWDHVGALRLFRHARVHTHRGTWSRIPDHLTRDIEANLDLDAAPLPLRVAGRHTRHHLMVDVRCADRTVVLAGDAAYLYRNVEDALPVAVTHDPEGNVRDVQAARERVGAGNVLPGHDPAVFERHPGPARGVATICSR